MLKHYLADAGVELLPEDVAEGPARRLRFRPSMGWVHTHS
jgi:chemotaxis receptor (MCP) glutamine deamidase CheD